MTDHEIYTEARTLITPPENFCQGAFSRDAQLTSITMPDIDGEPCMWCALGALAKAAGIENHNIPDHALAERLGEAAFKLLHQHGGHARTSLEREKHRLWVPAVNDGDRKIGTLTPHEAILASFDIVIEETRPK